ncbi:MAG: ElaB/YqjD/DUF883 family membrane-anchored ribosome-binding protein [Methylophilaceae bacterium]|jgi:ElaB/YqjD/DUF883 family membrane-anchored ribosome-binding protein
MLDANKKLMKDVKLVLSDLEVVLDEAKGKTSAEIAALQETLMEKVKTTKEKLRASEQDLLNKEKIAVEMTNSYAKDHVWTLMIVTALLGFLAGYSI